MAYLEGLLSGFAERKGEREQENLERARLAADREARVYETLLSSPDLDIQGLAAAGLLESAKPRRRAGGLKGWLGEMESSPYLSQIQQLIRTPVTEEKVTPGLPSRTLKPQLMQAPGAEPAALPAQATVEPGAPPPTTPTVAAPPPDIFTPYVAGPARGRVEQVSRPRRVFAQPEDTLRAQTLARGRAETETELERAQAIGFTPEEYKELERERVRRAGGAVGQTYAEGNVTADPSSPTGYSQTLYLRANPQITQKIPAPPPTTGARAPNQQELMAHTLYGATGEDPKQTLLRVAREPGGAEKIANVMKRAQYFVSEAPLDTAERFNAVTKLQDDWRQFSTAHTIMQRQMSIMDTAYQQAERDPQSIPAASEAIIISFERMLDPNSVVREAEARRPGSMQSLLGRIEGAVQRLREGGPGITLEALRPYVDLSREVLRQAEAIMGRERARMEATGQQYNLGPLNLIGGPLAPPTGTPPPPVIGGAAPDVTLDTPIFIGPDGRPTTTRPQ